LIELTLVTCFSGRTAVLDLISRGDAEMPVAATTVRAMENNIIAEGSIAYG
jgi:hypothetical protein